MEKKDKAYVMKQSRKIQFLSIIFLISALFVYSLWHFDATSYFKGDGSWYSNIALKSFDIGDFERALEYANKSIEAGYNIAEMGRLRIKIYEKFGLFQEAMKELPLLYPNNSSAFYYWHMGEILNRIGDVNGSLRYFNEGIRKYPLFADNYINAGLGYYKLGEFEKALEYFEHSKNLIEVSFPGDEFKQEERLGIIHAAIGFVYQKNGSISKAEKEFEIAKSKNRDSIKYVSDYLGI